MESGSEAVGESLDRSEIPDLMSQADDPVKTARKVRLVRADRETCAHAFRMVCPAQEQACAPEARCQS